MSTTRDSTVVDFIPIIDGGDCKKVYDYGITKVNQIILGVFHQLNIFQGTLDDFPTLGCQDALLKLYFTTSLYSVVSDVRTNFATFQNENINCDITTDPDDPTLAQVKITVNDIPNLVITADVLNRNQNIQIFNASIVGV